VLASYVLGAFVAASWSTNPYWLFIPAGVSLVCAIERRLFHITDLR
jgi:hypothetical protein